MPLGGCLGHMLAAAAGVILACAGPASASFGVETRTLDTKAGIGYVSSYGGYAAWSRRTGPSRYRLMIRHAGRTRALPVTSRRVPFDVSLGKDARGRTVAVFSRCRNERDGPGALPGGLPAYASFSDCRIRLVPVGDGGGRERAVRLSAGAQVSSRFMPAIAGSRLAYAGVRGRGSRLRQGVFTQLIDRRMAPRELRGGTGSGPEDGPLSVSFDGRQVLYAWRAIEAPCTDPEDVLGQTTELWRDHVRDGGHRLIRRAGCPTDSATTLQSPVPVAGAVGFVEIFGDLQTRIVRYDLSSQTFQYALAPRPITSLAFRPDGAQALAISPVGAHSARLQSFRLP